MSSKLKLPPGPHGLQQMARILIARKKDPLSFYSSLVQTHGDTVYVKTGRIVNIFITHPDAIQKVLQSNSKNYVKGPGYERLRSFLGKGLLTSEGELWRKQRKAAAPAFHLQQIQLATPEIRHAVLQLIEDWEARLEKGLSLKLDLAVEMNTVALSIVQRTLFSSESVKRAEEVREAIEEVLRFSDEGATGWLRIIDSIVPSPEQNLGFKLENLLPLKRTRSFHRAVNALREVVAELINERRASGNFGNDLLGALMKSKDEDSGTSMATELLRDEALTVLNAGHETTATSLSWTWLELLRRPLDLEEILEELQGVLGDRSPTYDDLSHLEKLTRFYQETLRLYPPFWRISRRALEADQIGEFHIPAGSVVVISPYLTHRDSRLWTNPLEFDPSRFQPQEIEKRHRYAYLPFGGGARICIGSNLAFVEALMILSMLLQRFKFTLDSRSSLEAIATITLKPRYGVPVQIESRKGAPH